MVNFQQTMIWILSIRFNIIWIYLRRGSLNLEVCSFEHKLKEDMLNSASTIIKFPPSVNLSVSFQIWIVYGEKDKFSTTAVNYDLNLY